MVRAVERLAEMEQGDVRRLENIRRPEWRLRVGDWRVRFAFNYAPRMIEVLRVLARGRTVTERVSRRHRFMGSEIDLPADLSRPNSRAALACVV